MVLFITISVIGKSDFCQDAPEIHFTNPVCIFISAHIFSVPQCPFYQIICEHFIALFALVAVIWWKILFGGALNVGEIDS
jgi:hypothetical protein